MISVDTLRADRLNSYGYREHVVSPNVDALAADGILFENFITASPWTTPAHLTMLTSLYPSTHGLTASFRELKHDIDEGRGFYKLPEQRVTMAETLRAAGFATGAFTGGGTVASGLGFGQGFDLYDESMYKLDRHNTRRMFDWIKQQAGRRFFLFWHNFEVHAPYLSTEYLTAVIPGAEGKGLARDLAEIVGGPTGGHDPMGQVAARQRNGEKRVLRERGVFKADVCEALYLGAIRSMDRWLGRLVALLRREGLYDSTLVVFTSDHGEEFGEHSPDDYYDSHGHSLYEEIVRVPLILKLPKQEHAGTRVSSVARMVDLLPTVTDIVGAPLLNEDPQGVSLRQRWEGGSHPQAQPAFVEAIAHKHELKGLRDQRYKYIVTVGELDVAEHGRSFIPPTPQRLELYDLQADPKESRNLILLRGDADIEAIAEVRDRALRDHVSSNSGRADRALLDDETVGKLKALGYVGGDQ